MIQNSVLRCGVRREEEIEARLSNEGIYELYRFCRQLPMQHVSHAVVPHGQKKMAPPRGAEPSRVTDTGPVRRERSGRKGGRRNIRCADAAYMGRGMARLACMGHAGHAHGACRSGLLFVIKGRLHRCVRLPRVQCAGKHRRALKSGGCGQAMCRFSKWSSAASSSPRCSIRQ
jgi:hypothetical protein